MKWSYHYISLMILAVLFFSCTGTKRLPDDKRLYTGAKIEFEDKSIEDYNKVKNSLKGLLVPEPNAAIFGQRPRLWIYNLMGEVKKEKGIKHWLKNKIGEPPVYFEDVKPETISEQLNYRLVNKGYFNGDVSSRLKEKKKKISVIYQIRPGEVSVIRNLVYPDSTNRLNKIIAFQKPYSLVKPGHRFDLEVMENERQRLEKVVQDSGYYFFYNRLLTFDADTTVGDHEVDLILRKKDGLPPMALKRHKISEIEILSGYSSRVKTDRDPVLIDSMQYYLDPEEIRARPVVNAIKFKVGRYYSREDENVTLNRLAGMGVFRYININFDEDTVNRYLRARINLAPYKRKSIRAQLNAVSKSNNFVGPFLTLSFLNRNFLGGAEQFRVSLNSGIETQINALQQQPLNSYEIGLNTSLVVPRFIVPFEVNEQESSFDLETRFMVGGRSQKRVGFFNLLSLDLRTGYHANRRLIHRYELYPVNINFLKLINTSPEFEERLENSRLLRNAYQEQFIMGGRYSFYYNSRHVEKQFTDLNNSYFNVNLNTSGNLIRLTQQTLHNVGKEGVPAVYKIGELPYAQFVKVDFDYRYYRRIDIRNRLATRLIIGAGYAYGNSESLPYTHQFAVGGTNSLRAFRPRSVGPGEYIIPDSVLQSNAFLDQTADIKLEMNIEYRFDLYKKLKGAVFVDAGNIWTIREDESRPGGRFHLNEFYKQIALGTGLGIRYDLDFLILRLDVATPLRIPYGPEDERWVIDEIAIDKKSWRQQRLIWNVAIGYPF